MSSTSWSFPLLSLDEILTCLQSMNIPVTREKLTQPSEATALPLYESLVEILFMRRSDLVGAAVRQATTREAMETFSDRFAIIKAIIHFMHRIGVRDFSLTDIMSPTPQRIRRNLSGVINFAKFHEEYLFMYDEATREIQTLASRKRELEVEQQRLESALAKAEAARAVEAPEVAALSRETESLERTVKELDQRSGELRAQAEALDAEVEQAKVQIAALKASVAEKTEELEEAQRGIVSSPDKLISEIKAYEVKSARSNNELNLLGTELAECTARQGALGDIEKRLRQCLERARRCAGDLERLQNYEKQLDEAKARVGALEQRVEAADRETNKVTKELGAVETQTSDLADNFERKKLKLEADLQDLLRVREALTAELESDGATIAEHQRAYDDLARRLSQSEREHRDLVAGVRTRYRQLEAAVESYHRRLEDAFAATAPLSATGVGQVSLRVGK